MMLCMMMHDDDDPICADGDGDADHVDDDGSPCIGHCATSSEGDVMMMMMMMTMMTMMMTMMS